MDSVQLYYFPLFLISDMHKLFILIQLEKALFDSFPPTLNSRLDILTLLVPRKLPIYPQKRTTSSSLQQQDSA